MYYVQWDHNNDIIKFFSQWSLCLGMIPELGTSSSKVTNKKKE